MHAAKRIAAVAVQTGLIRRALAAALVAGVLAGGGTAFGQDAAQPEPIGEEAFQAIIQFYAYDADVPLDARVVREWDRGATVQQKIVFRGVQGRLVPGYLEMPKHAEAPYPLVLLLHGWSGNKDSWYQDGNIISGGDMRKAALGAGYAVLALDAATHGERSNEIDYQHVNPHTDQAAPDTRNYFSLPEIYVQTVKDYRRALDYLAIRGDIDMERVGLVGYSMGGTQAFLLTAVEPRVKVSVACVVPAMRAKYYPVAPRNYAWGIAGRPFLMLMGLHDEMYTVEESEHLFQLIPGSQKEIRWYAQGHKLTEIYVPDALAWLDRHLKGSPRR